jgi:hypothetical protein
MNLESVRMRGTMQCAAQAAMLALLACPCLAHAADIGDKDAPFDRPLQTRRVTLGPSPNTPGQQSVVRCYTYPRFMVKEVDTAEVGDDQISVLALPSPAGPPACQAANQPVERIVPDDTWSGYFLGAKADYLFLSAADGVNGGMGFAVFRADDPTRKLFEDLTTLDHDRIRLRAISTAAADLHLSYTRLYAAPCSVPTDGAACWIRIVAATHVPATPALDCAAGYLRAKRELAAGRCEAQSHQGDAACLHKEMQLLADWDTAPSVVGYDVDVVLQPSGPQVTATSAAGSCWPAD